MKPVKTESWASDVTPSHPAPIPEGHRVMRDFGGIAMTAYGITHNVTVEQLEEMLTPHYAPDVQGMDPRRVYVNNFTRRKG